MKVVHVRCPSLAVITNSKGQIALLRNRGKLKHKNEIAYTPPGGAAQVYGSGFEFLHHIGAHRFKKYPDMRFQLPESSLPKFTSWFCEQRHSKNPQREIYAANRETMEELSEEEHILASTDFRGASFDFLGFGYHRDKDTVRFSDIFRADFPGRAMQKLARASEEETPLIRFVSKNEIRSGWTQNKEKIGLVSTLIIRPQKFISL